MFDQTQSNVIDGLLLGDASIPKNQNLFHFGQCKDRREYVELVATRLGEPVDRVLDRSRKADARTGKSYQCSELRTLSNPIFGLLRKRWYSKGVKRVPNDLQLTPECVLHWFLCDGSCSVNRNSAQMVLCTDSFSTQDVKRLQSLLSEVGIQSSLLRQNRLRIRQESIDAFYEFIGECPVECLAYKWIPEKNRTSRQQRLRPFYQQIYDLFARQGLSCSEVAKKLGLRYFSVRYVLKTHFGVSFGKNATSETTCREGVVAPSETARRAPVRAQVKTQSDLHGDMQR